MSAEDHLGSQFEIVRPHTLIRVGSRTYPAVQTQHMDEGFGGHSAIIPTEAGRLYRVAVHPEANHAVIQSMKFTVKPPDQRRDADRYSWVQVGTAHGVKDFHQVMDHISKIPPMDEEAARNDRDALAGLADSRRRRFEP